MQPEFGGTVQILDAYANVAINPAFQVRVGKFKTPIGLEQLQSDPVAFFNERSVATGLTPNRDVGLRTAVIPVRDPLAVIGLGIRRIRRLRSSAPGVPLPFAYRPSWSVVAVVCPST